jgi:multiple sugar transport system permease protein
MNFLIAVAINLAGMLLIYSLMANALARFHWHGRGTMGVLVTIILAGLFWIVPLFVPTLRNLDPAAYALWFGDWLVSGFSIVILCQSVRWIPRELEDLARLDGCGWFGIYRYVVLPLVRRQLGLIALLIVMATSPLLWVAFAAPTAALPPWLYLLLPMGSEGGPGLARMLLMMVAGSVVMTLPVMLIFLFAKRYLQRTTDAGGTRSVPSTR